MGLALSRRLGWAFEDLDHRIETQERRSIEQIFQQSGESGFRQIEHEALRSLIQELGDLGGLPKIVAMGGGAYAQANNAAASGRWLAFQRYFWTHPSTNYSGGVWTNNWSVPYAAICMSSAGSITRVVRTI